MIKTAEESGSGPFYSSTPAFAGWTEETLENLARTAGVPVESGTGHLTEYKPETLLPQPPFSIASSTV
jgi:hypothetical protein